MSEIIEKEISRKNLFIKSSILIGSFATLTAGPVFLNTRESKIARFFKKIVQLRIKNNCAVVKSVKGRSKINNTPIKAGDVLTGDHSVIVNSNSAITLQLPGNTILNIKGKSTIDMNMFLLQKGSGNRLISSLPEVFTVDTVWDNRPEINTTFYL